MNRKMIGEAIYYKSDSHETWKCVDPELERKIRRFPYGERPDVPRQQQVEKKPITFEDATKTRETSHVTYMAH